MKNQDLAVIGVRLLGLFILYQALQQSVMMISVAASGSKFSFGNLVTIVLPLVALTGLGLWVLLQAPALAERLAPDATAVSEADSRVLQAMLLATIGIYLVVRSIPGLVGQIAGMILPRPDNLPSNIYPYPIGYLFTGIVQVILGLILFFGAGGLAAWWHRARATSYDVGAG